MTEKTHSHHQDEESAPTMVVFRCFRDTGDVIALFPEISADLSGNCSSFMHHGQHGAACYHKVMQNTKSASQDQYRDLKKELESHPYNYNLVVRKKIPWKVHYIRRQESRSITSAQKD